MVHTNFEPLNLAPGFVDTVQTESKDDRPLVSLVIPAYNEEGNIPRLEAEVRKAIDGLPYDFEFIVVDNASTDGTRQLLRELCARDRRWRYIRFSRNFLVESSISAGYRNAKGQAIIVLYSDLQEPPELIPDMLRKWREGYDVVYGVHQRREGEAAHLTLMVKVAYRLVRWLSEVKIPADSGDFRLITSDVRDALEQCGEYHRYTRGLIAWLGFNQVGIPYVRRARVSGHSKSPFSVYLAYFVNAVTTFSLRPLRMFFFLGLSFIILAVAGLVVVACGWSLIGQPAWMLSLGLLLLLLSGINSVGLGIVGEYVGRTYVESRHRPRYIIHETSNIENVIGSNGNCYPVTVSRNGGNF